VSIDLSNPSRNLRSTAKELRRDAKESREDAAHHEGIAANLRKRADEAESYAAAYERAADQLDGVLVVEPNFNHVHWPDGQGGVKVLNLAETVEGSSAPPKRGPGRPRKVEK